MNLPLVSIIIPVYNAESFISETISSAINQTWTNTEIIIVDDGSTDRSLEIAKEFKNKKITVLNQQNKGASSARNLALSVATGDYIQFLDADDLLNEVKIETQVNLLLNNPYHLATCACVHFQNDADPFAKPIVHEWVREESDDPTDFLIKLYGGSLIGPEYGGFIALHSWLIPFSLIKLAGQWNEALSLDDDGEFMCRVILKSKGIKYAQNAVVYYRKHTDHCNISSSTSETAHKSLLNSVKLKMQYLLSRKDDQQVRLVLSRIFFEVAVSFYPEFPFLTLEAENLGKVLDPNQKPTPYKNFPLKQISYILGWRRAKLISRFKHSWKKKIS